MTTSATASTTNGCQKRGFSSTRVKTASGSNSTRPTSANALISPPEVIADCGLRMGDSRVRCSIPPTWRSASTAPWPGPQRGLTLSPGRGYGKDQEPMVLPLVVKLGLLAQTPALSTAGAHAAPTLNVASVRVWLSDSNYQVGARARVFVNLRDPGYLVVLHADAAGRIRVLFPLSPDES